MLSRLSRVLAVLAFALTLPSRGQPPGSPAAADVVVIVDTSVSMARPGMDPERASLLVTKLLTDIVPGRLTVIRLLDLAKDSSLVPTEQTNQTGPCDDNPNETCTMVKIGKETLQHIRSTRAGAVSRPERGSQAFKSALEEHLQQRSNNSGFHLAFVAAQGVFDTAPADLRNAPKSVVWLSDGDVRPNHVDDLRTVINEMRQSGVDVSAIVFGRGSTDFASGAGLVARRADGPAQLVEHFTDAFRRIVQAPYKIHALAASSPSFDVKQHIDEAWVVVYGDRTLGEVTLQTPGGVVNADYAQDVWPSAGAYKVAHFIRPAAGSYSVRVSGGGSNVSYGVVQRSSLAPVLIRPSEAISGVPFPVVAGLRAAGGGPDVPASALGEPVQMTAEAEGRTVALNDDGKDGDATAGDGQYSGMLTLSNPGDIAVKLHAKTSTVIDRRTEAHIRVTGHFRCPGCEVSLNFGSMRAGDAVCRDFGVNADQQGRVPFEIRMRRNLPSGYRLIFRSAGKEHSPGDAPVPAGPGEAKQICLSTKESADGSSSSNEPWAAFAVAGRSDPDSTVALNLTWNVRPLSFWERWGWLILAVAAILIVLFVIYGYIRPYRFPRELAIAYTPEYSDLDDQIPMPLKQWRDVKIGWYRDARAYFLPDFRISGRMKAAVAMLQAAANRAVVAKPVGGHRLFRETSEGDWEAVPPQGRRVHNGDVYRVGDSGPHFRIAARLAK